ncbi:MAG: D-arabinono-1,4-lactone oxidase, partial [Streptosporangiaceae bacterium]
ANQNLAAAVTAQQIVTADGDIAELRRGDDSFPGAVVHLGALGVVTHLVLEVVPSFDVSQRVYEDLPLEVLDDHFADIMASGYSVSLFTDWRAPRLTQIWIKQRLDGDPTTSASPASRARPTPPSRPTSPARPTPPSPVTEAPWFAARPAPAARNPVPGAPPENCTGQLGVPGRWFERLPHFRPEFTPSAGHELQSEYLLPAEHAVPALRALHQISDRLAPVLQICEVRVIAADDLWLSSCYQRDSVAFHFTWIPDTAAVLPVLTWLERQLAPFGARPHWGKVFTTPAEDLHASYDRLPDFLNLAHHYDPAGKFRNAYTNRYLSR